MAVKSHVIVAKLAKAAEKFLKPDVAAKWPEQNEALFHMRPDGKIRSISGDLKVSKYLDTVLRAEMPSLFLETGQADTSGKITKRNNPWTAEGWSATKQGALVKAIGLEKAAAIAKAAGSFVGATKPGLTKNLTQSYTRGADGRPQRIA